MTAASTTYDSVPALVAACTGQTWPSESTAPADSGVLVSITPHARIETRKARPFTSWVDYGSRLMAWAPAGENGWDRDPIVVRAWVPEDEWEAALAEMAAEVQATRRVNGPVVLAALAQAHGRYAWAQGAADCARARRDCALADALAAGHTHEVIAGWMGLTRGRVGQLAITLRERDKEIS